MTDQRPVLLPAVERIRRIEAEIGRYIIGRSDEIHGLLLALVARQHVFFLGSPGSGKSWLSSELARRIRGGRFFRIDLHPFTMREELFGPISLSAMRERDALERKWEGYLPGATIAQLDEIWRCPPATLNTLLTILNEREFRQDELTYRSPLVSAITSANELPPADRSLDALYDRILLRYAVSGLTSAAERRAAAGFSLKMRAIETAARRFATELGARRDEWYFDALAGDPDEATLEALDAEYAAGALALARPEKWIFDRYGERLSIPDERRAVVAGEGDLPEEADRRELLARMARWIEEEIRGELPYRTYLAAEDLDALAALALAVRIPDAVEEALYRVLDRAGAVSVRREAELRTLVAAETVLSGRSTAAVRDLRIAAHVLWDQPDNRPTVRRLVEEETGNLDEELAALAATIDEWAELVRVERTVTESLALRDQMDLELGRFAALAESYGDQPAVHKLLSDARNLRDRYEAAIFDVGGADPR